MVQILALVILSFLGITVLAAPAPKLQPRSVQSVPTNEKPKDRSILKMGNLNRPDEKITYAEVIQAYRQEDLRQLLKSQKVLLKFFPRSIYADNSLYLLGILLMKKKRYGKAIKVFDRVITHFPRGNKRASAIFAKSVVYKNLNLNSNAKKYFKKVIKDYPGSIESQRAWVELRLMKVDKKSG